MLAVVNVAVEGVTTPIVVFSIVLLFIAMLEPEELISPTKTLSTLITILLR